MAAGDSPAPPARLKRSHRAPPRVLPRVAAVVLAAGASSRLGGPKALLRDGRGSALARVVAAARAAGCDPVVVVVGAHAERVRPEALLAGARVVENAAWARGRSGSARVGLAAAGPFDAVLVWPVDHPAVSPATARALVGAFAGDAAAVVVPSFEGKHGHPILLRADVAVEVAKLGDDEPLRNAVWRVPARVRVLAVEDAGILVNVDTPEDAMRHGWSLPP